MDSVQEEQIENPWHHKCEKDCTERDAVELSRGVGRKSEGISPNSARDSISEGKIGLKVAVE